MLPMRGAIDTETPALGSASRTTWTPDSCSNVAVCCGVALALMDE